MSTLTTEMALDLIAHERAPKYRGTTGPNKAVHCADGFRVSIQASWVHYSHDSEGKRPDLLSKRLCSPRNDLATDAVHPFVSFELDYPSEDVPGWPDADDSVWGYVPRETVAQILDAHGGVVAWGSLAGDA